MTAGDLDAYLARLGLTDRPPATLDALREIHRGPDAGMGEGFAEPLPLVRGLVHRVRTPTHRDKRDLTSYDEWRAALVDDLLLPVADVTDDEWASLWQRTQDSHRAWHDAGRP